MPVWKKPPKPYDANSAFFTMSKKGVNAKIISVMVGDFG
jgi:hypothetical protein